MGLVETLNHSLSELLEFSIVTKRCRWVSGDTPFSDEEPVTLPSVNLVGDTIDSTIKNLVLVLTFIPPDQIFVPFVPHCVILRIRSKISKA